MKLQKKNVNIAKNYSIKFFYKNIEEEIKYYLNKNYKFITFNLQLRIRLEMCIDFLTVNGKEI